MIDHLKIPASDVAKSKAFYQLALAPLGYSLAMESEDFAGFASPSGDHFFVGEEIPDFPSIHVAFRAASRDQVRAFYEAAIAAGGRDNGEPALCPEYHPTYFGAFVLDPDGHNIEAVCHDPE